MRNFDKIYEMQRELNIIIGRDTVKDPEKLKWLFDYLLALQAEIFEMIDCLSWKWWSSEGKENQYNKIIDLKNAKIEAIDSLHFLMSIIHILDIKEPEINIVNYKYVITNEKIELRGKDLLNLCLTILDNCNKITNQLNNKFSDNININFIFEKQFALNQFITIFNIVRRYIIYSFRSLCSIFEILEMSDDEIYEIYKMKHEKNILRQKNGYSVLNKTEADNNEIKEKI